MQKKKKIWKYLALSGLLFFTLIISAVQAADVVSHIFTSQTATASGSNNSVISVDSNLEYVNRWNNSSIVWNYFTGYYYDSIYWFFETDWSSNPLENVRVIWSTSACSGSYGYKLGWYAYSPAVWFVDFDFNSSVFVYYCVNDNSLYGYTYSDTLGLQNFEGITFDISAGALLPPEVPTGTWVFVNDDTSIIQPVEDDDDNNDPLDPEDGDDDDSNFSATTIQNDIIEFNADQETLFYIIK